MKLQDILLEVDERVKPHATLYHSTLDDNVFLIQETGLKPSCQPQTDVWGAGFHDYCINRLFLIDDPSSALAFGMDIVMNNLNEMESSSFPVLFRVQIRKLKNIEFFKGAYGREVYTKQTIPPDVIEIYWNKSWSPLLNFSGGFPHLTIVDEIYVYLEKRRFCFFDEDKIYNKIYKLYGLKY